MVHVTGFFAGLLAFIFIGLSVHVIRGRGAFKLGLGDGGQDAMQRRIRAQANFAEYTPFALILMAVNEMNGSSPVFVALAGIVFVAARLSHAYSLLVAELKEGDRMRFRIAGMATTFMVLSLLALAAML